MDKLPVLIPFTDYNCDSCGYSSAEIELNNIFLGYCGLPIRKMYMIHNYLGEMFCHQEPIVAIGGVSDIVTTMTMRIAYNYCQSCIKKALYEHYNLIFTPIDYKEIYQEVINQYNIISQFALDCSDQIFTHLTEIKISHIKEMNIRSVIDNMP
jgi:hypothetical protein